MQAVLMSFRHVSHGFKHLELQTLPLHFVIAACEWDNNFITGGLLYVIMQHVKNCILSLYI